MTYPSAEVTTVLEASYIRVIIDTADDNEITSLFSPSAIPVSIVLNADGKEQGRFVGFANAEDHAKWLGSFVK
ncbi:MAG: hypothetical protein L3J82_05795 [Planctomycetes bacterium]|nr:hypothetical protein [Planctomycetota bacterium]